MKIPSYGTKHGFQPKMFLLLRILQGLSFVIVIGITANFVSEIVSSNITPPNEIIGTLAVTSLAAIYCCISTFFFMDEVNITLVVLACIDFLLCIAFVVIAVVLGKPVSYLNCFAVSDSNAGTSSASAFTQSLGSNLDKSGATLKFPNWTGATKANCFETKAVWGLSIGLCVTFFWTSVVLPYLWAKNKRNGGYKSYDG